MLNPESLSLWKKYIRAVQEEVKPALGCTEPVSLALASATAAAHLPGAVDRIEAWVSPNLMKNGMGVTVPGTGMAGLPIAAALGAVGGDANGGLQVLEKASARAVTQAKWLLEQGAVRVMLQAPCDDILYARAKVYAGERWASATIVGGHTRIVSIEQQGATLFTLTELAQGEAPVCPLQVLAQTSLREIVDFIERVPFDDIRFILDAAHLNEALSREGLRGQWGLHVGATLQKQRARGLMASDLASDIVIRTSAASDARMGARRCPR